MQASAQAFHGSLMSGNALKKRRLDVAVFSYLGLITISQAVTTAETYSGAVLLRGLFFAAATFSIIGLIKSRTSIAWVVPLVLLSIFLLWALSGSILSGSIGLVSGDLARNIVLLALGTMVFGFTREGVVTERVGYWLLWYFSMVFLVTVWFGGFKFSWPPGFEFAHATDFYGAEVSYSLGVSSFYAIASLTALHLATTNRHRVKAVLLVLMSLALMLVTFFGGARGESAVLLVLMLFVSVSRAPFWTMVILSCMVGVFLWFIDFAVLMDSFVLLQRLSEVTGGYYGLRDQLLVESLELLKFEPVCLMVGCGAGFFQHFYGYPSSLYPHNILAEWVIVVGAVSGFLVAVFAIRGLVSYVRGVGHVDLFVLIFLYSLLVNLKSGSLLESWLTVSGAMFFMAVGLLARHGAGRPYRDTGGGMSGVFQN